MFNIETLSEKEILDKYPNQFRQYFECNIQTSCMAWGLEVPEDWYPIIDAMCAAVEELNLPIEWGQIKEKFNGLRAYWDEISAMPSDQFYKMEIIVERAEELVEALEKNRR